MLSRALTRSLLRAVHTGCWRRRERLLRLCGGACFRLAGGGRHSQSCVSSHPWQRGLVNRSGWGACAPWCFARADGLGRRCMHPPRPSRSHPRRHRLLMPSRAFTRSHARAVTCCARAQVMHVAVSGSYAYVAAAISRSLVVIDTSNPASPAIRGSVVSWSLLHGVRATQFCDRGRPQAPLHASAPPITLAPAAPPPADALLCFRARAVTCCVHRQVSSP